MASLSSSLMPPMVTNSLCLTELAHEEVLGGSALLEAQLPSQA